MRAIANLFIFAAEVAVIAGLCWLGSHMPLVFAGVTALAAMALGIQLERARLLFEIPFYFSTDNALRRAIIAIWAVATSLFKGLLAGLVALLTFSGTAEQRIVWIAAAVGLCIFIGSSLLRRMSISLGARGQRWGFFRLAAPLGLLYAQLLAGLTVFAVMAQEPAWQAVPWVKDAGLAELAPVSPLALIKSLVFDLAQRPGIAQTGDMLFKLQQAYDGMVQSLAASVMPAHWAWFVSALVSVKLLTGFIIAIYAVLVSEMVRVLEERLWRSHG